MSEEKFGDGVRAVDRALQILAVFGAERSELSALELSRRLGLSRPTLYRLLYTLERQGFITSIGEPQRFRLGPMIGRLGSIWSATVDVNALAQPLLRELWAATGETIALLVRRGDERLCLSELPSAQPLSFKRGVGYAESIATGASGRAILAWDDTGAAGRLVVRIPGARDGGDVEHELAAIRERGYAVSRNELIEGAVAVAAPYFGANGAVAGSIALFGPQARLSAERIGQCGTQTVAAARRLSTLLGVPES